MSLNELRAFDRSLDDITANTGGFLECRTCGKRGAVLSDYWRHGWPKCCGHSMRWWTKRQIDAGEVEPSSADTHD